VKLVQFRVPISCTLGVTIQLPGAAPFKLKPALTWEKNGDLPGMAEGAGILSDHCSSLKLLFTISRQKKK